MLETGFEIDRYVVEEQLGEGGMAVVYRVRHATLGTRHALKVLTIASRDVKERLIQEGRVQATLRHPHIVAVTDVLEVAGSPGLLMEFIQGPALDHWLYNYQPALEEALVVFRALVAGVGHAHAQGLIHRDLKPANVLLHVDDRGVHAKVADFGLAKLTASSNLKRTRTGTTMGTPAYMAPEQIRDASTVDRRADLYSLGCILFELVCGRTPYEDDDIIELFAKVAAGDYPPPRSIRPDLPQNVVDCIDALLEVNRDLRVSDCQAALEILDGADKSAFTTPIDLTAQTELPPPKSMGDPGRTSLEAGSPGHKAALRFVKPVVTPVPVERIGSLAPGPSSRLDLEDDRDKLVLDGPDAPPVRRSWTTTLLLLVLAFGLFTAIGAGLGAVALGLGLASGVGTDDPPTEPVPTAPQPVPEPAEPEPAEPEPVPEPAPEPVQPPPRPSPTPTPVPIQEPAPAPEPEPVVEPSPDLAAIVVVGDRKRVASFVLTNAAGERYTWKENFPAGTYDLAIRFTTTAEGGPPIRLPGERLRPGINRYVCMESAENCVAQR